jgi:hypothetical protein
MLLKITGIAQRNTRRRPALKRLAVAAGVAALSLGASASPANALVTIGQLAPGTPTGFSDPSGHDDIAQPTVTSGNTYVVPGTGLITSWSHNAATGTGQKLMFKVFRHVSGSTYAVVGHDGPRPLTGGGINTFPASIPVIAGDIIGLSFDVAPPGKATFFPVSGDSLVLRSGNLLDGQSGDFALNANRRVNATAAFQPANSFILGATRRSTKKGTATITVNIPNPGELTASGHGIRAAGAVAAPGHVKLLIRAKGRKRRKLNTAGTVKLNVAITYLPTGGDPRTQSKRLKLKKV